jgi:DGQHR domain-containing protein
MGDWDYYVVKMKMKDVAKEVYFASEVHEDATLDEAIQRTLTESRAKGSIVDFLCRREDRFFSSIVIAALGGNATFYPVSIADDPQFKLFADQKLDESFGVLTFDGSQNYYALDGQHRLKAIKTILDPGEDAYHRRPAKFENEEVSVIVVLKRPQDNEDKFKKRYRRLFASLNRYAKPTDADTNIIMDEDDAFAIITRRLISEYAFFSAPGKHRESFRILTKGKNLKEENSHFTSLQTLYEMNKTLLYSVERETEGWGNGKEKEKKLADFIRFRPDDEYIDQLYAEVKIYWDALIEVIPDLKKNPPEMRVHSDEKEDSDHLLFWPIGQEMLATVARRILNRGLSEKPTKENVKMSLSCLGKVNWKLHSPPWRYLLLIKPGDKWKMRNEERKQAVAIAERILFWIVGYTDLSPSDISELKKDWEEMLIPVQNADEIDRMWGEVSKTRKKAFSS